MSIKKYQQIKIGLTIILAITFSQLVYSKNFLIPVGVLVISSLILLYLRRQVREIIADERDYQTGGKAALQSIQIFSWIAVIGMFALYSARDLNPAFEPIALTLAYSTCILMLIYSAVFKYHHNFSQSTYKFWYIVAMIIIFLILAVFSIRVFSGEDDWICQNGQWTMHGQPDFPAPTTPCQ